jgi:hypothetical protein
MTDYGGCYFPTAPGYYWAVWRELAPEAGHIDDVAFATSADWAEPVYYAPDGLVWEFGPADEPTELTDWVWGDRIILAYGPS